MISLIITSPPTEDDNVIRTHVQVRETGRKYIRIQCSFLNETVNINYLEMVDYAIDTNNKDIAPPDDLERAYQIEINRTNRNNKLKKILNG